MNRFLAAIVLCAAVVTRPATAVVFTESGGSVVIEAEGFTNNITHSNPHHWDFTNTVAGFSGTGYMEALPNDNDVPSNGGTTWLTFTPELQYAVNFTTAATHYVWIRCYASNGSDDSIHAGLDSTTNAAAGITLVASQYGAWSWTTNRTGGVAARPTISVTSTGLHTFSLWMREDGMRVDQVALTTDPNIQPTVGNVFHIPNNLDADVDLTMRNPQSAIYPATRVELYTANQFQGAGNPGNQLQSGSTIFYKHATNATWSSVPMFFQKIGTSNPDYKYYSNSIPPNVFQPGDVVQYYFRIPYSDHLTTYLYGNDAQSFASEYEAAAQANPFSYTVKTPPASMTPSPADWRDLNIYQVITDRFYDGDPSNNLANPDGVFDPAGAGAIHGGDFKGLQQKLDYIRALGANAIWISPIVRNTYAAYHGYLGWDFYSVDPHWGTFDDLTNMVAAAHARGIYVLLDVVCNHGGDILDSNDAGWPNFVNPPGGYTLKFRNPAKQYLLPFNTNALNPTISSLFHTNGFIQDFNNTTQVEIGELRGLDDLRTELTYVRTNMANIWQYWIGTADIDGFRVDTTKHIENPFWQYWCPQIHQFGTSIGKSNFFFFGETLTGSDSAVGLYTGTKAGGNFEYDSMLDYALYFSINPVFAQTTGNTKQIEDHYNNIAANYDASTTNRLVIFLDNHDQSRFLSPSNANNNTNRLFAAFTWLYTSRGIPSLYYGTEQAFNSVKENNREDMFAGGYEPGASGGDNFNETHPLFQLVAKLNNFRRLYPSLRRGAHVNLWNDPDSPGLFAYARRLGAEETFVVFNTSATSTNLPNRSTSYSSGTVLVNLFNTNETLTVTATPEIPSVNVPGRSAKIFISQSLLKPLDPVVLSQTPAHGATNVSPAGPVVLQFSKPMDTNSVQAAFSLAPGTFSWNTIRDTTTFTANGLLPALTTNVLRIATNAMDSISSNTFYAPFETYFVTAATTGTDVSPPSVSIATLFNGTVISGALNVSGTATDDVSIAKVEIRIDAGNWATVTGTTNWSLTFDTANFLNGSHQLSARATDTSGNISTLDSKLVRFINIPGNYVQRVSAGSFSDVTNCDSIVWSRDQSYVFGSFGYIGGLFGYVGDAISNITCVSGQLLYQRDRSSTNSFRYFFDCPEGIYETMLLESETRTNVANGRVFNVSIEGQQVLTNLDLFATTGGMFKPLIRVFTNVVTDAQLQIEFTPVIDAARASGIQVRKIADVDTDFDGIPDWWTLAYFDHPTGQIADKSMPGDDPDGDGLTNLQEFLTGTDPTDPSSAFRITNIAVLGLDLAITWTTGANRTNQLERATTLGTGAAWNAVGPLTIGTGLLATQADPGATTNPPAFYRVRLVP